MKKPFPHTILERHREFMRNSKFRSGASSVPLSAESWYRNKFYRPDSWDYLTEGTYFESMRNSVAFDITDAFSRMTREQYVKFWKFSITLLENHAYPLPFDDCTFVIDPLTSVRVIRDPYSRRLAAFMMSGLTFVSDPSKVRSADQLDEWSDTVVVGALHRPEYLMAVIESKGEVPQDVADHLLPTVDIYLSDEGLKYFHIAGARSTEGKVLDYVAAALAINLMMMSPFAEVVETPEPVKLNKAREKKNRPPINRSYLIKVRDHKQKARTSPLGIKGTHASPEPHWRRGHLRQIRADYIVPVVPHVVGAAQGDVPEIGKKMYEMVCEDLRTPRDKQNLHV